MGEGVLSGKGYRELSEMVEMFCMLIYIYVKFDEYMYVKIHQAV